MTVSRQALLSAITGGLFILTAVRDSWRPGCLGQSGVDPAVLVTLGIVFLADAVRRARTGHCSRLELQRYLKRYNAYRSKRPRPAKPASLEGMVYEARVSYERRLAAISEDPQAAALAGAYVDNLRPCYEWEGYHHCPEREAEFAAAYLQANPGGPFHDYLPLLAAHRWLCAAEAYKYEKQPEGAARSRKAYERMIQAARHSRHTLIRTAAEGLAERNICSGAYSN